MQKHANTTSFLPAGVPLRPATIKPGYLRKHSLWLQQKIVFDALNTESNSSRDQRTKNICYQLATLEVDGSPEIHSGQTKNGLAPARRESHSDNLLKSAIDLYSDFGLSGERTTSAWNNPKSE